MTNLPVPGKGVRSFEFSFPLFLNPLIIRGSIPLIP
jgi:hypothetical protein